MDSHPLNELTKDKSIRSFILVVLALLAAFLAITISEKISTFGEVAGQQNSITVEGTGKASAAPTIAQISFTVEENAATTKDAQDAATKRMDAALAAIKKLGIDDKDVQASGYQINPQYATPSCPPGVYCPATNGKISGYQASETVTVKVRDTGKTGDVLQALATAGVQNVSGPNFTVDDTSAVTAEARGKAIADARAKAEVLANQLGVHLGKVMSFSESGGAVPYFAVGKASAAMDAAVAPAPTLPTGQNETSVSVSVTYEIR